MKKIIGKMRCLALALTLVMGLVMLSPTISYADCTGPAAVEGVQIYNTTHKTMQYCDGTNWIAMKGGSVGDTLNALTCNDGEIAKWNNAGSAWQCAADDAGVGSETDPQVGAVTNNKWCRGNGSAVVCDQDAPSGGSGGVTGGGVDRHHSSGFIGCQSTYGTATCQTQGGYLRVKCATGSAKRMTGTQGWSSGFQTGTDRYYICVAN